MQRVFLCFALSFSLLSFAAGKRNKNGADAPPPILSEPTAEVESGSVSDSPRAVAAPPARSEVNHETANVRVGAHPATQAIWVGPGVVAYDGNYGQLAQASNVGLALNLGWMMRLTPDLPLLAGIDGGINFWNSSMGAKSVAGTGIQLLPTVIYQFTIRSLPALHPFLGASFGPHFYVGQSATLGSTVQVFAEFLVRLGVQWDLSQGLAVNFEPKFGVLNSTFISIPQLTASLAL